MYQFRKTNKLALAIVALAIIVLIGLVFVLYTTNKRSPYVLGVNTIKTPTYPIKSASLLGLDKVIESPHFAIYFHASSEKQARQLIQLSENDYTKLVKFFPTTPKTKIFITNSASEYINVFNAAPPWSIKSYQTTSSGGGAFCVGCAQSLGKNTDYIYMLRPGTQSFAHELAHRYFWASYPKLRNNTNLNWLNEGLAVYAQTEVASGPGGLSGNILTNLRGFSIPKIFSELEKLHEKGDPKSTERYYDLVGLLAYYISGKTGDVGLQTFIKDLNTSANLDKTTQKVLKMSSSQFYAKWKDAVTKTVAANPVNFIASFQAKVK